VIATIDRISIFSFAPGNAGPTGSYDNPLDFGADYRSPRPQGKAFVFLPTTYRETS
jgi:hypothetical protein